MFCMKCGAANPDSYRFCQKCGAPLRSAEEEPFSSETAEYRDTAAPSSLVFQPQEDFPGKRRKKRVWLWLTITVVLLGAVIAGCIFGVNAYQSHRYQEQLSLGEKYAKELNYEDAVVALNAAIEIDPKKPEPYVLLADIYIAQGEYEKAEAILEEGYKATGGAESIRDKQEKLPDNSPGLKEEELEWVIEPIWEYDAVAPIPGSAFSDIEGDFADGEPLFPEEEHSPFCEMSFSSYSNLPEYYAVKTGEEWHVFHMPSQTDTVQLEKEGKVSVLFPYRHDATGIDLQGDSVYVSPHSLEEPWDVLLTSGRIGKRAELYWDVNSGDSYFYSASPYHLETIESLGLHKPYPVKQIDLDSITLPQSDASSPRTLDAGPGASELLHTCNLPGGGPSARLDSLFCAYMQNSASEIISCSGEDYDPYAYVSPEGEQITDFIYTFADSFSDGLAACSKEGQLWGYIDEKGQTVTEETYSSLWDTDGDGIADSAYPCTDGTMVVLMNGEYGLLYRDGSILIAFGEFEALSPSWNNQLWAKQDGKWGLIDLNDAKKQAGLDVTEQDEPPQESEETIDSVEYSIERDDRSIRDAEGNSIFDVYFDTVVIEGNSSVCNTINQQIEKVKDSFFTDIDPTVKSQTEAAKEAYDRFGAFRCSAEPEIMTNGDGSLSIRWLTYSYFGGVGVGGALISNFDLKTGELLELEDLYSIAGTELREYLQQQCVEYVNQHPEIAWSDFGEYAAEYVIDHASLEQYPFYIQNGMVYIQFDQYELAAGAAGNISIPCPII